MDTTSTRDSSPSKGSQSQRPDQSSASFHQTFESIEALIEAKGQKLLAAKELVEAEAKLSLSAILLSFALCLLLVVITTIVWALINTGVGYLIIDLTGSYYVAFGILLAANFGLAAFIYYQVTLVWELVGFSNTATTLRE